MRKLALSLVAVGTAITFAAWAGTPSVQDKASAQTLTTSVRITGFRLQNDNHATPMKMFVDVTNSAPGAVGPLHLEMYTGGHSRKIGVADLASLPSKQTWSPIFTEDASYETCRVQLFEFTLTGPGAETRLRRGYMNNKCAVTGTIEDAWNLKGPDQVAALKKNSIYLTDASIAQYPNCEQGLGLKVKITNHTNKPAASLIIRAITRAPQAESTRLVSQTVGFPLAAGETKTVEVPSAQTPWFGDLIDVELIDWTKSLNIPPHAITIKTTKSCAHNLSLEP